MDEVAKSKTTDDLHILTRGGTARAERARVVERTMWLGSKAMPQPKSRPAASPARRSWCHVEPNSRSRVSYVIGRARMGARASLQVAGIGGSPMLVGAADWLHICPPSTHHRSSRRRDHMISCEAIGDRDVACLVLLGPQHLYDDVCSHIRYFITSLQGVWIIDTTVRGRPAHPLQVSTKSGRK